MTWSLGHLLSFTKDVTDSAPVEFDPYIFVVKKIVAPPGLEHKAIHLQGRHSTNLAIKPHD